MVTIRCLRDLDHVMRKTGGQWEPGICRWLIERRRIGLLIPELAAHRRSAVSGRPG
jgi:hypothetical protein